MSNVRRVLRRQYDRFVTIQSFTISQVIWSCVIAGLCIWFFHFNSRFVGTSWFDEDPMAFTGFMTVILGVAYSVVVDRDQKLLIYQWYDAADKKERTLLHKQLTRTSLYWEVGVAMIAFVLMAVGYLKFYGVLLIANEFMIASTLCAVFIGARMGRMVAHGRIGSKLKEASITFSMSVEHPDHAGGLAKIGNFYLFQASILLFPIVWLLVWLIIIPSYPGYKEWAEHFFILMIFNSIIFMCAFLLPMLSFKEMIACWKSDNVKDRLAILRTELIELRNVKAPDIKQQQHMRDVSISLFPFSTNETKYIV